MSRATGGSKATKNYNFRMKGITTNLGQRDSKDKQHTWISLFGEYVSFTGSRTIAYRLCPITKTQMVDMIKYYHRFTEEYVRANSVICRANFDSYDLDNNNLAKQALLNSLESGFAAEMRQLIDDTPDTTFCDLYMLVMSRVDPPSATPHFPITKHPEFNQKFFSQPLNLLSFSLAYFKIYFFQLCELAYLIPVLVILLNTS